MTQRIRFMLAMSASVAGTLFFVACQPRFDLISPSTGQFAGIACFMVSSLFWGVFGLNAGKES